VAKHDQTYGYAAKDWFTTNSWNAGEGERPWLPPAGRDVPSAEICRAAGHLAVSRAYAHAVHPGPAVQGPPRAGVDLSGDDKGYCRVLSFGRRKARPGRRKHGHWEQHLLGLVTS